MATDFTIIGSAFGPLGTLVSGIIGGGLGYYLGSEAGGILYDTVTD